MSRKPTPTPINHQAARELAPVHARRLMQALGRASEGVSAVAIAEAATPEAVVVAVAKLRAGQSEIDGLVYALAGVAVLGGAAYSTTARAIGLRPGTLAEKLRGTWASARGEQLARDPARTDGWTLQGATQ